LAQAISIPSPCRTRILYSREMTSTNPEYAQVTTGSKEGDKQDEEGPLDEHRGAKFAEAKAIGQVTIRFPLDFHPLNLLALTYGFLPWLIPIGLALEFFYTWHFIYIYGVMISIVLAIINEGILKKIFNEGRPTRSANKNADGTMKHGMPSGHVLNSTSIMLWSFLEVYLKGPGLAEHQKLTMTWLGAIVALMFPVPWARWYNYDHSVRQCVASILIGTVVGFSAFYIRVHYCHGAWKPWDHQDFQDGHAAIVSFWRPPWAPTTAAPSKNLLLL